MTFSTTYRLGGYRLAIPLGIYLGWNTRQFDIINVTVYTNIDIDIYITESIGFENNNEGKKTIYELRKAS